GFTGCGAGWREVLPTRPLASDRFPALAADACLQLGLEGVDIAFVDAFRRYDDQAIGGNAGLVAFEIRRHQLHALIAPGIWILHDGSGEAAFPHRAQRDRILVEADDGDLAELACSLQGFIDLRRVVRVEADHAVYVRVRYQDIIHIGAGASEIDVVA